jgi:cobalt/nickel transport system permease protein
MHIPDGFLNAATAATTYVVSVGGVGYSIKEANRKLGDRHVPLMGVMGAFVFAAQMLNFPVIGGTSGHLIGGALVAILLGPWAGTLIMTCVLIVQCLVFQDGGLTALGANVFNMGLIACFVGYYLYQAVVSLMGESRTSTLVGGGVGAWTSVFVASIVCAIELAISGKSPLGVALPAMAGVHALIGIGEGLITSAVLAFVTATRADLLKLQKV